MLKKIIAIIPAQYKVRGVIVAITILLRACLNFFGITLLIPLLILILEGDAMHQNDKVEWLYNLLGCKSDTQFTITIAIAIVVAIALKISFHSGYTDMSEILHTHCIRISLAGYTSTTTDAAWHLPDSTIRPNYHATSISYV